MSRRRSARASVTPASSTKAAMSRGPHAVVRRRCGRSRAPRCAGRSEESFATSAPYAGGVTGSIPPEKMRVGTSLFTGVREVGRHCATRPHAADRDGLLREAACVGRSASTVLSASGVMRGTSSAHVTEKCSARVRSARTRACVALGFAANSGANSPFAARREHLGQQHGGLGRIRQRLQRGEHDVEGHPHAVRLSGAGIDDVRLAAVRRATARSPTASRRRRDAPQRTLATRCTP